MDKGIMDPQPDDDLIQRDVSEITARAAVLEEETETRKALESLSEAAAKIVPSDLAAFLAKQNAVPEAAFWSLYFYLESAFTQVSSQWLNVFKEFPWSHDVSSSHIPKFVYETSDAWINQLQTDRHCTFVMWALDHLLTSWAAHAQDTTTCSSKSSEVAAFVALAIMLRSKPLALTYLCPMLRDSPRYHGEDKLPVILWTMAQAFSKDDLSVGLYSWAHYLLPLADNSKGYSPQSVDLILRFAVFILSEPDARTILLDEAAVRKEDQLIIPPSSFEILVRLTFPASSARVEATVYPLLKEVAFAPGSKTVKQIFTLSFKLFGDGVVTGNPFLAKEATAIAFRCVTENVDCFMQWYILYKKNIEASVALLKKLVDEWKDHSLKLLSSPSDTLTVKAAIHKFRIKNKNAITEGVANCFLYKEADKSCKLISSRLSPDDLDLPPWLAVLGEDEEAVEIPDKEEVKAAVPEEKTETQKALASLLWEDEEAVEIPDEEEVKAAVPEEKTETQKALASLSGTVAKLRQSLMDFRIKLKPKEEEEVVLESSCPEAAAGIGPSHLPILPDEVVEGNPKP